jgi:hypothetical protein
MVTSIVAGAASACLLARHLLPGDLERRPHVVDDRGVVRARPAGLARAAGVSLPVYVLASVMQSEERTDRGRLAVGRAAWNAASKKADRIVGLAIPTGQLGTQDGVRSYASTALPPTAQTLGLALAVIEGRVPDFVEGAVQWDAPAAQDRRHALYLRDPSRYPRYRLSSADVAARRVAAGAREVRVPGVTETRFWTYS